ncbi:acyl-CoA carboxylase subunit beta [Plantactinospora endophytica]|uniref:Propionyl-CoA carboxylase beta chain 6 n=1 Tax=Plantactinospora endophytica TaxID=673535 RepID=A0ABQ4E9P1_9ACTN|nr:carboxyl transferase domain-containing protein [Plantactinospora endophytica]GIG91449.1 putative propionyl-CoA carboxylase beta chain 6 [Plantactinospora endophytica]
MTVLSVPPVPAPSEPATEPRDPVLRMERTLDPGTLELLRERDDSGVCVARGRVDGSPVIVYCTDATRMGGSIGGVGSRHIVEAIDAAVRDRVPVLGLWHSGGAKLAEGVESMDGVGRMFAAMIRASGRVPQISVVLGPAAGAAAYGPALTDLVVLAPAGRLFVTGPEVVRSVTGEQISMEELGGADAHGRRSGVAHVLADSEEHALQRARQIVGVFAATGWFDPAAATDDEGLRGLLPDRPRRAYDVRPLVHRLLDPVPVGDRFIELQARWAPNVVVGFGRLTGRSIGVVANNPLRRGGCLDTLSAEKAARFVRMCDSFGVPLLVVVDVPGYLPGVGQEWDAVVRRGAKLLYAFGEAVVPRVTLVTRKSYGGAYIAMNSRALGATRVFAWPEAEVAVMGAQAAVGILHRKRLAAAEPAARETLLAELVAVHERESGGVARGLALGVVDEVIEPATSRRRVAEALAGAPAGRGHHGNIPL